MATYNIDKTIQTILNTYIQHVGKILHKEYWNVRDTEKYDDYVIRAGAYDFLRLIASDTKHYLYEEQNIHLRNIDGDKKTIYEKLSPICGPKFDNGTNMLVKLSQAISSHIKFVGKEESLRQDWIWNDKGLFDSDAKEILELNKQMQMINSNEFSRMFLNLFEPKRFAVKENNQNLR
ncbi:MAG: hypothetical protein IKZ49_00300 [Alphaproteobacteria bacterium]|nr:hypothetical protein [Alphaproteobacteria bacterium]